MTKSTHPDINTFSLKHLFINIVVIAEFVFSPYFSSVLLHGTISVIKMIVTVIYHMYCEEGSESHMVTLSLSYGNVSQS